MYQQIVHTTSFGKYDRELYDELVSHAKANEMTLASVVKKALKEYFNNHPTKKEPKNIQEGLISQN